jgi:hypothetical protein
MEIGGNENGGDKEMSEQEEAHERIKCYNEKVLKTENKRRK